MEGVGAVTEACGPSKFLIPRTSLDKLQLELLRDVFAVYSIQYTNLL